MNTCQNCGAKYSGALCPSCKVEGQEESPDLVVLCTVMDEAKAHIMRGFLESEGIPCQLENISFHADPIPVADLIQVRLWTLKEDVERANELLAERENIQICSACKTKVEEHDEVCPYCGERLEKS